MLLEAQDTFSDTCSIQYRNKQISDNMTYVITTLNTMYSDMNYLGFSDDVHKFNDYYNMIDLALLYAIVRDNNDSINTWEDFVKHYDLAETIHYYNCQGYDISKILEDIETCTPIRLQ
jgi:hypothetical protein